MTGAWLSAIALLRALISARVAGRFVSWFFRITMTRCVAAWLCAPATAAPRTG